MKNALKKNDEKENFIFIKWGFIFKNRIFKIQFLPKTAISVEKNYKFTT